MSDGRARTCASAPPAGTTRRAAAPGTASSTRRRRGRAEGVRRAAVLRRALRHGRSELDLLRPAAGRGRRRGWAERTPAGFEFSVKLYQKFTHPKMFKERVRQALPAGGGRGRRRPARGPRATEPADLDEFRARHRSAGATRQAGRAAGAVSAELQGQRRRRATTSCGLLERVRGYRVAVELRHRSWSDAVGETLALLNQFEAAWVQIDEPKFKFSIRQNYLPNVAGLLLHAAARPERGAMVAAREIGGSLQLPVFRRRAAASSRNGGRRAPARQEGVPLHEQSLLGEVGRERGDDQAAARRADRRRVSGGVSRALSGAPGVVQASSQSSPITSPSRTSS